MRASIVVTQRVGRVETEGTVDRRDVSCAHGSAYAARSSDAGVLVPISTTLA